jgi:hypothetical protein
VVRHSTWDLRSRVRTPGQFLRGGLYGRCGTSAPLTSARRNVRTTEGRNHRNVCTTELGTPDGWRAEGCRRTGPQCRRQQGTDGRTRAVRIHDGRRRDVCSLRMAGLGPCAFTTDAGGMSAGCGWPDSGRAHSRRAQAGCLQSADGRTRAVHSHERCTADGRSPALWSADSRRRAVCICPRRRAGADVRTYGRPEDTDGRRGEAWSPAGRRTGAWRTPVGSTDGRRIQTAVVARLGVQPAAEPAHGEPPSAVRTVGMARAAGCARPEWRGPGDAEGRTAHNRRVGTAGMARAGERPRAERRRVAPASGVRTSQTPRKWAVQSFAPPGGGCLHLGYRRPHFCADVPIFLLQTSPSGYRPLHPADPLSGSVCRGLHAGADLGTGLRRSAARCRPLWPDADLCGK